MSKRIRRGLAAGFAAFALFGMVGCGEVGKTNNNVEEEQPKFESPVDDSTQQQIDALKGALQDLQKNYGELKNQLDAAKNDILDLKEADKTILTLVNSNMSSVTEAYSNLLIKVNALQDDYDSLNKNVGSLDSQLSALKSQHSELNTQLQSLSSTLTTLAEAIETLQQNSTTQNLAETINKMQSKINQLIVQNALNLTLNTRYNKIAMTDQFQTLLSTNPNGEYSAYTTSVDKRQYTVKYEGIAFQCMDGRNSARKTDITTLSEFSSMLSGDYSAEFNGYYTATNGTLTTQVSLTESGCISQIACEDTDEKIFYNFIESSSSEYQNIYNHCVDYIPLVGYYKTICEAMDASFDYKYAIVTGEMTADDGVSGSAKLVVARGRTAQYQTTQDKTNLVTNYGIIDKNTNTYVTERNGEISVDTADYMPSNVNAAYLGESLKQSLFDSNFIISVDQETNTFNVIQQGKQSFKIVIDEDGKFTDFEMTGEEEYTGFANQKVTYHIEGVDKATFEREFKSIKDKMDELIAQYNEGLGV